MADEKNVADTEREMREHERQAREREPEERSPEGDTSSETDLDQPGPPGNVQQGGRSG